MPVSDSTVKSFTDLGIVGAALLIVLIVIIFMFAMQSRSIDKLCTKIDNLITHSANQNLELNKVLLSNDKDQKTLIKLMTSILEISQDTNKRTIRIDDRTYSCIGNTPKDRRESTRREADWREAVITQND